MTVIVVVTLVVVVMMVMPASNFIDHALNAENYGLLRAIGGHRDGLLEVAYTLGVIHHLDAALLARSERLARPLWNSATTAPCSIGDDQWLSSLVHENELGPTVRVLINGPVVVYIFLELDLGASLLCNSSNGRGNGNDEGKEMLHRKKSFGCE